MNATNFSTHLLSPLLGGGKNRRWAIYASSTSGEAYRDRRLTTNFELWVEIFFVCRHVSMWGFRNPVCLYPEKRNRPGFVNISRALVIYIQMGRSSRVLQHWNPKSRIFFKKFEIEFWLIFWLVPKSWNHFSFVNISPTLVIDTSMERSSRILHNGNTKIRFFSKNLKLHFDLCQRAEIVQVGLNMHLYDDIGDVSSSLRGSTSSLYYFYIFYLLIKINKSVNDEFNWILYIIIALLAR